MSFALDLRPANGCSFFSRYYISSISGKRGPGKRGEGDGKSGQIYFSRIDEWHRVINKSVPFSLDIVGTLKDMAGNPVPKLDGGGYWNHLKEMSDRLNGLRNHAKTLNGVNNPSAQAARQKALDAIDRIEDSMKGFGI